MMTDYSISSFCHIKDSQILVDGNVVYTSESKAFGDFSKEALRYFGIQYPKFFKMDALSKLAFLGSELLLKDKLHKEDTALLFANSAASLDTDIQHQSSIQNQDSYYPSPAVFVYTLPNICLGEISIRHGLKTENSFFIFGEFNPDFMSVYAQNLLENNRAESVLCGWVELLQDRYEAFIYLVSKEGDRKHTKENIFSLYNI